MTLANYDELSPPLLEAIKSACGRGPSRCPPRVGREGKPQCVVRRPGERRHRDRTLPGHGI